jgi:hypothetical protein
MADDICWMILPLMNSLHLFNVWHIKQFEDVTTKTTALEVDDLC